MIINHNGSTATQEYKDQLNDLMSDIFGFTFKPWHDRGFWQEPYQTFSIIENGKMLSSIGVFHMDLMVGGKHIEAMQIGGVATREEHRGKGLSRMLMDCIFSLYPKKPSFLFANDSVVHFYPKFGYVPLAEQQPFLTCKLSKGSGMVKLDMEDEKVDRYLKINRLISNAFDCLNAYTLHWFHILNGYAEDLYEIPELGVMLIASQEDDKLCLNGVFSPRPVSFGQLMPCLSFDGVETVSFGFNPDGLDVHYEMRSLVTEDSTLFVLGFPDFGKAMIPFMLRT